MNVLVDSSVWSLALRRNTTNDAIAIVKVLRDLIADGRVVLLGAIRQEVLSGVRYLAIEKLAIERVSSPHRCQQTD